MFHRPMLSCARKKVNFVKIFNTKCFFTVRLLSEELQHLTISFKKLCQTSSYKKYYGAKYFFTILVHFGFTL